MGKDIWHRYDETPKHQDIIITDTGCWAYRTDLLALETELERTRKILDKAIWWLNEIVENHRYTPITTAEMALKEIKGLEQKDMK